MSLNYQAVHQQIQKMGEDAQQRQGDLKTRRERAWQALQDHADQIAFLRRKVEKTAAEADPNLRCALPVAEALNTPGTLPSLPRQATVLAADGSQIAPDRHAEVEYCLINVGAIQISLGSADPPLTTIDSQLMYHDQLDTPNGTITEARLALWRDLAERRKLADLAQGAPPPVITFTDGPMELWGGRESEVRGEFEKSLQQYKDVLRQLFQMGAITAGYVDKPSANLVVRLLEVAVTPDDQLEKIRDLHPLHGVTDLYLFRRLLQPGQRSAVFAIRSRSAAQYPGELGLHFFYMNVGRNGVARVETPAWVALEPALLDALHATLFHQCRILGARPYPYLLHRAHEAALVSFEEKEQVTQMIVHELMSRGLEVDMLSFKQANKNLPGKSRYRGSKS